MRTISSLVKTVVGVALDIVFGPAEKFEYVSTTDPLSAPTSE